MVNNRRLRDVKGADQKQMSGSRWSLAKNADLGVWLDLISNAYYYLLTVQAIDGHRE